MALEKTQQNRFKPWGIKQDLAIFSQKPIIAFCCGVQSGKTTAGALSMKLAMCRYTDKDDTFLITAPTYKVLNQSTLPAFLRFMEGLGTYHRGDAMFKMHSGGTCFMRTATDPDSIVGITNIRHIWGDEAGLYSLYFWENMQARAAFKQASIVLTTSPYSLNWMYKELIKPKMHNHEARPDVELIQATSIENPYFPKEMYESRQKTMDPRRFRMMFGGSWEQMEGLVYDCFCEEANTCDPLELPEGTKFYGGIDWGYTNAFVFQIRAITPAGLHYQIAEFYQSGLTITDICRLMTQKSAHWKFEAVYCDPSQPAAIEELNRHNIPAVAANNDIRHGIDLHYELIRSRKFKLWRGRNQYSMDEYQSYHYPSETEISPDKDMKERLPVKQDDHAVDTARYITAHTYCRAPQNAVMINEISAKKNETNRQRIERLKELKINALTESWS